MNNTPPANVAWRNAADARRMSSVASSGRGNPMVAFQADGNSCAEMAGCARCSSEILLRQNGLRSRIAQRCECREAVLLGVRSTLKRREALQQERPTAAQFSDVRYFALLIPPPGRLKGSRITKQSAPASLCRSPPSHSASAQTAKAMSTATHGAKMRARGPTWLLRAWMYRDRDVAHAEGEARSRSRPTSPVSKVQ